MRVLLLGAKGMLGRALAGAFADDDLVAWDKEELDITDERTCRQKISVLKPDIIINAAAYTDVDGAETHRKQALAVNGAGAGHVAGAAAAMKATVVHYSTDYVFAGDESNGYREDDKPGPAVNFYGESKLAGERALLDSGATYYLIRTAWLYGPGGKNFVDTMLQKASEQDEIRVVNDQHGSPTYTRDLAQATKQLLAESARRRPGIYHLVNSGTATWHDLAQEIVRLAHKQVRVIPIASAEYPRPARRPAHSVLINTQGVSMRHWRQALKAYIQEL